MTEFNFIVVFSLSLSFRVNMSNIFLFVFQTTFNAPEGDEPLALDMNTMSKGQVWINGQSIGRYWTQYKASNGCTPCNYTGWFTEKKCLTNCGEASQKW